MSLTKTFEPSRSVVDTPSHYCPGCGHGVVHRLICEVIDEMGLREKAIAIAPVGCAVNAYNYWDFDCSESAHGRAHAVATAVKRIHPDKLVFTYQGDGDLAAIGMAETIHAANRGENFSVIFINNTNYGMTSGQLAPTTMLGQKTITTPGGRDAKTEGYPLRMAEMLALLPGVRYAARTTVADFKGVVNTKKAIRRVFSMQMAGEGYGIVEVLTNCNTNWGMSPVDANQYILDQVSKVFPVGVIKDEGAQA